MNKETERHLNIEQARAPEAESTLCPILLGTIKRVSVYNYKAEQNDHADGVANAEAALKRNAPVLNYVFGDLLLRNAHDPHAEEALIAQIDSLPLDMVEDAAVSLDTTILLADALSGETAKKLQRFLPVVPPSTNSGYAALRYIGKGVSDIPVLQKTEKVLAECYGIIPRLSGTKNDQQLLAILSPDLRQKAQERLATVEGVRANAKVLLSSLAALSGEVAKQIQADRKLLRPFSKKAADLAKKDVERTLLDPEAVEKAKDQIVTAKVTSLKTEMVATRHRPVSRYEQLVNELIEQNGMHDEVVKAQRHAKVQQEAYRVSRLPAIVGMRTRRRAHAELQIASMLAQRAEGISSPIINNLEIERLVNNAVKRNIIRKGLVQVEASQIDEQITQLKEAYSTLPAEDYQALVARSLRSSEYEMIKSVLEGKSNGQMVYMLAESHLKKQLEDGITQEDIEQQVRKMCRARKLKELVQATSTDIAVSALAGCGRDAYAVLEDPAIICGSSVCSSIASKLNPDGKVKRVNKSTSRLIKAISSVATEGAVKLDLFNFQRKHSKGRLPIPGEHGMYIALDSAKPDLKVLTKGLLEALSASDRALDWTRHYGRVMVGINNQLETECVLLNDHNEKTRNYTTLRTTALIEPRELVQALPEGSLAEILINEQPTTAEGLVITYAHLIDELVLDTYRTILERNSDTDPAVAYREAVSLIMQSGFSVRTASTEEILQTKKTDPRTSIRVYGSGVNKEVPQIMGAVVHKALVSDKETKYIDELATSVKEAQEVEVLAHEREPRRARPIVATSITLGKRLHAGHMFLLATADLLRKSLGDETPLVLVNNNTGPRPAGTLVTLSKYHRLSLEETAGLMSRREIEIDEILSAYKDRYERGAAVDQATHILDKGNLDIFASVLEETVEELKRAGLVVNILQESDSVLKQRTNVGSVNPRLRDSGMSVIRTPRGLAVLQRAGELTLTGKAVASIMELKNRYAHNGDIPQVVMVEGSKETADAVVAASMIPDLQEAVQIAGTGVSINGTQAHGTTGETLTINELNKAFLERHPDGILMDALRHLVLTRPLVVRDRTKPDLSTATYEYRDNESLVSSILRAYEEHRDRSEQIPTTLNVGELIRAVNSVRIVDDPLVIKQAVEEQGYTGREAEERIDQYISGKQALAIRNIRA